MCWRWASRVCPDKVAVHKSRAHARWRYEKFWTISHFFSFQFSVAEKEQLFLFREFILNEESFTCFFKFRQKMIYEIITKILNLKWVILLESQKFLMQKMALRVGLFS